MIKTTPSSAVLLGRTSFNVSSMRYISANQSLEPTAGRCDGQL
jgi:hypothetical protein